MVGESVTHLAKLSGHVDWQTPPHILQAVRRVFGREFTFDPASSPAANERVNAAFIYRAEDDALTKDWKLDCNDVVWMNPPYARGVVGKFVDKFLSEIDCANGCVLVNSDTGTKWYQKLLLHCDYFVLLSGRLAFIDGRTGEPKAGAAHAQTLFFFGHGHRTEHLRELGTVCVRSYRN